jgi:hypothetical protein
MALQVILAHYWSAKPAMHFCVLVLTATCAAVPACHDAVAQERARKFMPSTSTTQELDNAYFVAEIIELCGHADLANQLLAALGNKIESCRLDVQKKDDLRQRARELQAHWDDAKAKATQGDPPVQPACPFPELAGKFVPRLARLMERYRRKEVRLGAIVSGPCTGHGAIRLPWAEAE